MFSRVLFLVLALALTAARPLFAQQTVDVGSLSGRVTDATGAAVPGASVTATHVATRVVASAITERDGRFRFPYLHIGAYQISVSLPGFVDATRTLTVSAGS